MFIIFGSTTRKIKEDEGYFLCPQCQTLRPYLLQSYQSWFTLFFIPLFPIGDKRNRHVECKECGSTFIPRVLENNTFNADGSINLNEEKVAAWEFY